MRFDYSATTLDIDLITRCKKSVTEHLHVFVYFKCIFTSFCNTFDELLMFCLFILIFFVSISFVDVDELI